MAELKSINSESTSTRSRDAALESLASERAYAQTLGYMMRDLIDERGDDGGGPASQTQRMYVVVEALQGRLDAIEKIESELVTA